MSARWDSPEACDRFDAHDSLLAQMLGYPFAFRALGLDVHGQKTVLDYGCGPGKIADRVARAYKARVFAADASREMLAVAARKRPNPLVEYWLVGDDQRLPLPDRSMDAAMSCFLFVEIPSLPRIRQIVAEVYRVLRAGAVYAVLDPNPDAVGVPFSTVRRGEPGRRYRAGEQLEVRLSMADGEDLRFFDYYWPKPVYQELLDAAGFRNIRMQEPALRDATTPGGADAAELLALWEEEPAQPPFVILTGEK